jgi:hypothetical protein
MNHTPNEANCLFERKSESRLNLLLLNGGARRGAERPNRYLLIALGLAGRLSRRAIELRASCRDQIQHLLALCLGYSVEVVLEVNE